MTKTRFPNDPYAERELEKYDNPLPSREYIMQVMADAGSLMTLKQLAAYFELDDDDDDFTALGFRMRAMERDGQVIRNRRAGYGLVSKLDLVTGRVMGHADGFGFLIPDEGGEDLFLGPKQMRQLFHGDRAVVRKAGEDRRGRLEGALVEVLERAHEHIVGRYFEERGLAYVTPSNKRLHLDIAVPPRLRAKAKSGQMVMVQVVEQPSRRSQPVGKVVEVLGDHMAPGMEIDVAIRSYGLPMEWSDAVQQAMAKYKDAIPNKEIKKRVDLRDVPLVTIDGEDARDFDDAVFCERYGKGWRLLVAIADVSHYVQPELALDKEAYERGTSVYFPDRVIPMLPEVLSNGLCSLKPKVDRLCMVCELFFTAQGGVRKYRFFDAVMHSHARLTYDEVAEMVVEKKPEARQRYHELMPHLDEINSLYKVLRARREKRGAIDFDRTETRIIFSDEQKIEAIVPVVRYDSHKMIEEFMVAANVAAAKFLESQDLDIIYRVHEGPSKEKLGDLRKFLAELGLKLGGRDKPKSKHYGELLQQIQDRDDAHLIQTVLLRSLSQAVYAPDNEGHFGLSFDAYTHFTSPIRRYPDLLVHRAIRYALSNEARKKPFRYSEVQMKSFGEHCSNTERRADEATRDATDWLKCEFMQSRVGEVFSGTITSVTSFGIFVELDDIYVEGLVHVTALQNDYYKFDPVKHRLVGERTNRSYRLTDKITVQVARVNLDDKKIDFELAGTSKPSDADQPKTKPKKKNKKDRRKKTKQKK
ncbi:3'-to-5' exoribonuclease RNase R [hydrothermal vent metagenome]|uniref:exoribonuclease II n=1 Tax=hydrothermal vent metagenome TaxID=652676 RepID=A0A3B0Z886_9ZZZZ